MFESQAAKRYRHVVSGLLLILMILMAACTSGEPTPERPTFTPIPRFEQVATSTEPAMIATMAANTTAEAPEVELNPTAVARGASSWERLECASCHGENGAGGTGSIGETVAPPLAGTTLTEEEFIGWLRTGGSLGNDHLFSTDRLSDSGGRNLYQYVLSLGSAENE